MSSYFDSIDREVRDLADQKLDEETFLAQVEQIEARLIRDVSLAVGDREMPEEFREVVMKAIALYEVQTRVPGVPTQGRRMTATMRRSWLSSQLHDVFHEIARARIETRFGMLFDSPTGILLQRDEWEKTGGKL